RVVRFDRAAGMLRSGLAGVSVADVAAVCGYVDQAHLARDVARLAGCTPGELAAGDVPIVQGAAPLAG
ncbi:MAG: helix-turn-helix domain-containing protein, partial [Acidimicrobiales bacterium]